MKYDKNKKHECFCPFCLAKKKNCTFQPGSFYWHIKICKECIYFQNIIKTFYDSLLEKISELCCISNISLNILQTANPFFRTIKRSDIRNKFFEIFNNIKNQIKSNCSDEFYSILLDGVTRNNKIFYGFIIPNHLNNLIN